MSAGASTICERLVYSPVEADELLLAIAGRDTGRCEIARPATPAATSAAIDAAALVAFLLAASTCRCSRCGMPTGDLPETCWACGRPLCVTCWDAHGECGHAQLAIGGAR